jgi:ATP-dependent DNA helicase RecG
MNALVHRDYFKKNEQIMIKIYDDTIWFHNPGGLPKGLSIEQLKAKPQSIPRNPLIARIFYLAGYIERYGSGIQRILTSFADAGLPEPEFQTDVWGLTLRMQKDIFTEEYLAQMGLNERQLQVIPSLRKQGSISNREYQDLVSVSTRTALYDLTTLVNKGVLVRIGSGKSSRYALSSKPKNARTGNS